MAKYYILVEEIPTDEFRFNWSAEKGKDTLGMHARIDCKFTSPCMRKEGATGGCQRPRDYNDRLAVKGYLDYGVGEGFWIPEKVWNGLKEYEADATVEIRGYLRWKDETGKHSMDATRKFDVKAKLVKTGTYTVKKDDVKIPGVTFKLVFEPISECKLIDWFTDITPDSFHLLNFRFYRVDFYLSFKAKAEWRETTGAYLVKEKPSEEVRKILESDEPLTDEWFVIIGDGHYFCKTRSESTAVRAIEAYKAAYPDISWTMRLGTQKELGALPATNCEDVVGEIESYSEALEKGYIVLATGSAGALMYDPREEKHLFFDYSTREFREVTEEEAKKILEGTWELEEPALEGYITLAEKPDYGKLLYNPEKESYLFYDYRTMATRTPTDDDFMMLGIENPTGWMKDVDTTCHVCKQYKEALGLTDEEVAEAIKATAQGQVIPITETEFAVAATGLFGIARSVFSKLAQAGAITLTEWIYTIVEGVGTAAKTAMENAAKGLGSLGIIGTWSKISKYLGIAKDAFLTSLWIGGFTPFICEEAAQALGMAVFIARQVRDPDLLENAINRYEQIVTIGKELTEKFGILNPFTYDAFKLFFQAAMDSLEIYRKLPDKIKEENEEREKEKEEWAKYREERKKFHEDFKAYWEERKKQWEEFMDYWEERKRSWEAFMERDVEKTLSIMINTVTDSLRAIYFGMRTGVETISLLKRLLKQITEETARARIEKMIEEAQKRIQDISANYEEIVQRGLEYASQVQDDTARASYESYILTLREQIEMELMRAEAEEIPIVEGIFKKGYLYVMGYPRYCRIYLNGEDTGKLAPERFVLDPGKYELKVVRETGEEWVKEVEVKEGETTEVIYYIPRKEA